MTWVALIETFREPDWLPVKLFAMMFALVLIRLALTVEHASAGCLFFLGCYGMLGAGIWLIFT